MIAVPLEAAPAELVARWQQLHALAGATIHQSREYAMAVTAAGRQTWVVSDERSLGTFVLQDGIATSLGATRAMLASEPVTTELLRRASETLAGASGARRVYFPHVHAATLGGARIRGDYSDNNVASWPRLPSPHVDCAPGEELWERVCERYGSRAVRQRRRAEARGLSQRTLAGDAAIDAVDQIERRSWKARVRQSMHHRDNQYALYSQLLHARLVTAAVLLDGERPVAFRVDARCKRIVCCLKWSYDEAYRRYSPGFYLLTCGLARDWNHQNTDRIDLFGSPDTLKALIATGVEERVDLTWPASAAKALASDRQAHDRAAALALRDGMGLRRLYAGAGPLPGAERRSTHA